MDKIIEIRLSVAMAKDLQRMISREKEFQERLKAEQPKTKDFRNRIIKAWEGVAEDIERQGVPTYPDF